MKILDALFGKRKTLDYLSFDTFGWEQLDNTDDLRSWVKSGQSAFIGIECYDEPYPSNVKDIAQIRIHEREEVAAKDNGGLISCEKVNISGFDFIKTITKEPQTSGGISYIGKLVLPLRASHVTIMIKIFEVGVTGLRDSIILQKWMSNNLVESDEHGFIVGWVCDPYDASYRKGRPMNLSEQEQYDADFPEHPLSELRVKLKALEVGLRIDSRIG